MLATLILLSFLFVRDNKGKLIDRCIRLKNHMPIVFFFCYLSFIMVVTIFTRSITNPYSSIFQDFGLRSRENGINIEMVENVLLFIPYSYFFCLAFKAKANWKITTKISFYTSLFIELVQLVFWLGKFQLSDVLHNTIGGIIGYLIWKTIKTCKEKQVYHIIRTEIRNTRIRLTSWINNRK